MYYTNERVLAMKRSAVWIFELSGTFCSR